MGRKEGEGRGEGERWMHSCVRVWKGGRERCIPVRCLNGTC